MQASQIGLLEPRETTSETEYFLPRAFRGGNWGRDPISKMAMRVTTEAVKLRFPGVSNMSTDELFQLINANNSKLILLVSCMFWLMEGLLGRSLSLFMFNPDAHSP